jgi:hypothetical protein
MVLNLSLINKDDAPLVVADILIHSEAVAFDNVSSGDVTYLFKTGVEYTLQFDNANGIINAGTNCNLTFNGDATLNTSLDKATMDSGSYTFTPTADVTSIDFLLDGPILFNGTIEVYAQDTQITVDDGNSVQVFDNINDVAVTVVDNANITLTVTAGGHFTYNNTFTAYTEDLDISIMMIENITDMNDPEYMQVYANFFLVRNPCSFEVCAYYASSMPFGAWTYYINDNVFGTAPNSCVNVCEPGNYTIRVVVSRAATTSSCGTVSLPESEDSHTDIIEVLEYKPLFTLSKEWDCCPTLGETYSLYPASLVWNNTHGVCNTNILRYTLVNPDGTEELPITYDVLAMPGNLDTYNVEFIPSELGTYTLKVEMENCCTTETFEYNFEVCNSWIVTNPDCNIIKIENKSSQFDLTYTIKYLTNDNTFDNVEGMVDLLLTVGNEIEIDLTDDNIYTITITQENNIFNVEETLEYIVLLDCNIRKCKTELIRAFLCDDDEDCACSMNNMTRFTALSNIIYYKWNIWKKQQSIYTTLDINAIVDDIATISSAMTKIKELCEDCANDKTVKDNDCGCN